MGQVVFTVPEVVAKGVAQIEARYETTHVFYAQGEAVVHYSAGDGSGAGWIRVAASDAAPERVLCAHIKPLRVQVGLPDRFNASLMHNPDNEWWPNKPPLRVVPSPEG